MRGNRTVKLDANHGEIMKALRSLPAAVKSLAIVGDGMPDLLVAFRGVVGLLEVKSGSLPHERKLTAAEQEFQETWPGPLAIVSSPDEARRVVVEWARRALCSRCATDIDAEAARPKGGTQ